MTFGRADTPLHKKGRGALTASFGSDWNFDLPIKEINKRYGYALAEGSIISFVVEMATAGRVHKRQFGRLPLVGPYSDWQQCLGLAIRIEWMTSSGPKCHYAQKKKDRFEYGDVPSSYLEASSLVAAFKGVVYDTTNKWRKHKATKPFRVVKLSFDNLSRTLKIEQLANYVNVPESTKQSVAQIGQILKDVGLVVCAVKPANFTQQTISTQRFRCDSCIAVGVPYTIKSSTSADICYSRTRIHANGIKLTSQARHAITAINGPGPIRGLRMCRRRIGVMPLRYMCPSLLCITTSSTPLHATSSVSMPKVGS